MTDILRLGAIALAAVTTWPLPGAAQETEESRPIIEVVHAPKCPCCARWAAHLEAHGFRPDVREVPDDALDRAKTDWGVPKALQSCHSARVGRYVIEGHIPSDVILQLLHEQPDVLGIAVPGMPEGSPGMDKDKTKAREPYRVLTFRPDGSVTTFAER